MHHHAAIRGASQYQCWGFNNKHITIGIPCGNVGPIRASAALNFESYISNGAG